MAGRLENKTVVVVGAGQTPGETIGNGRAMSVLFAREGAEVMCVDIDLSRAEETVAEIENIKRGADAGWSAADAALIKAADELVSDHFITDATWAELGRHFTDKQRMDVVFTTGQYTQVSMILNSFGVQLDAGQTLDPELKGY